MVRVLGWTPFIFHTVELKPFNGGRIQEQIRALFSRGPVDWIVLMSPTGVRLFFDNLPSENREMVTARGGTRFLAVGPRTKEYLLRYGVVEAEVPKNYSSSGIDQWFSKLPIKGTHIVLVRSSSADNSLSDSLRSRGGEVATVNVYESGVPRDTKSVFDLLAGLQASRFDAVLFTSSISVSNFFRIAEKKFEEPEVTSLLKRVAVGAIGPVTADRLRENGIEAIVPEEYLLENAITKLINSLDSTIIASPSSAY